MKNKGGEAEMKNSNVESRITDLELDARCRWYEDQVRIINSRYEEQNETCRALFALLCVFIGGFLFGKVF